MVCERSSAIVGIFRRFQASRPPVPGPAHHLCVWISRALVFLSPAPPLALMGTAADVGPQSARCFIFTRSVVSRRASGPWAEVGKRIVERQAANPFRVGAYRLAAETMAGLPRDLQEIVAQKRPRRAHHAFACRPRRS